MTAPQAIAEGRRPSDDGSGRRDLDLRRAAAVIALAIGMVAVAVVLYRLIDIIVVVFLGVVVAAALQPSHAKLCEYGVPRGLAVLVIYLVFLVGLVAAGLLVAPVLVEQVSVFVSAFPETYANAVTALRESHMLLLRVIGQHVPALGELVGNVAESSPRLSREMVSFTSGILTTLGYFVTVLAIGFFWTMEVPWMERLVISFVPMTRRSQVLEIWHEIELKLGAFIRGQGLAMLAIGVASAIGYALIGLPNVFALALLAGLLEAVPLIGPILAAVPAILVALPLGATHVALVIAWSVVLQGFENQVLIPRIMGRTVGMSSLIGLLAILSCGTLYGIVGVAIAIPLVATISVVLDRMVINAEVLPEADMPAAHDTLAELRTRVESVRQQTRRRFRERETRIGIDPLSLDHVVDAADQQLEKAAERVAAMIQATQRAPEARDASTQAAITRKLAAATARIEQAVAQVETIAAAACDGDEPRGTDADLPVGALERATQRAGHAVERVQTAIASTDEGLPAVEPRKQQG